MIHKATAKCSKGHTFEYGPCNQVTTKFFIFSSTCTSEDHEVLSRNEIQCKKCKAIHMARPCPKCDEYVPVEKFNQKTAFEKMMKGAR